MLPPPEVPELACTQWQAIRKFNKPVLCVLESDADKGGTSVPQLRAEVEALECSGAGLTDDHYAACVHLIDRIEIGLAEMADIPTLIEWHREKALKAVALKAIIANILKLQLLTAPSKACRLLGCEAPPAPADMPAITNAPHGFATDEVKPTAQRDAAKAPDDARSISQHGTPSSRSSHEKRQHRGSVTRRVGGGRATLTIRHPLQLRLTGEGAVLRHDWARRLVYLHAAYRTIPGTGRSGHSTFEEVCEQLSAVNIHVTERTDALRLGVPILILLCPGVFHNAQLVALFETLTAPGESSQHGAGAENSAPRWRRGLRRLDTFTRSRPIRHLGSLSRIGSVARIAGRPARTSRMAAGASAAPTGSARKLSDSSPRALNKPDRTIVRLFCTCRHFAYYIAQCEEHARHLADAGLFNEVHTSGHHPAKRPSARLASPLVPLPLRPRRSLALCPRRSLTPLTVCLCPYRCLPSGHLRHCCSSQSPHTSSIPHCHRCQRARHKSSRCSSSRQSTRHRSSLVIRDKRSRRQVTLPCAIPPMGTRGQARRDCAHSTPSRL